MACGGCQQARRDLVAAARHGDVRGAIRAAGKGARIASTKVASAAPRIMRSIVKRVR